MSAVVLYLNKNKFHQLLLSIAFDNNIWRLTCTHKAYIDCLFFFS